MKFALHFPNFGPFDARTVAELAQEAEAAGWDGVFVWDHISRKWKLPVFDPWITLGAVALSTKHLRIGTLVTPLARRRPQKVARETVSLDRLSNGRLILGVGLGSPGGAEVEWANFGEEMSLKTRAVMTDEALAVLTGLWSGQPFSFHGEHYAVAESLFLPPPVQQPRIPIWTAAYFPNKAPLRRAAKWDGLFPIFSAVDNEFSALREMVAAVMLLRESDRPFDVSYIDQRPTSMSRAQRSDLAGQAAKAGATWWLEDMTPVRYQVDWEGPWPLDRMRDMIMQGPPRG